MTDSAIIAIFASLPPTIAAIAALVVSVRNGAKTLTLEKNMKDYVNGGEIREQKLDVVHDLVNKNFSDMKAELMAARALIEGLKESVVALKGGSSE